MGRMAVLMGLTLIVGFAACSHRAAPQDVTEANPEAVQHWADRWINKSDDEVMLAYGVPDKLGELSTGNRLFDYHGEVFLSRGGGVANQYGGVSSSRGVTYSCDRRFEIDKDTRHVVRAMISGNRCDFKR